MDYLKPIEQLRSTNQRYLKIILALISLLGVAIVGVPYTIRAEPYLLTDVDHRISTIKSEPWKKTVDRFETFARAYASARFEWTPEIFAEKKANLSALIDDPVQSKLNDSIKSFESLTTTKKTVSYVIFESFGFSNSESKIEVRLIQIIRIKNIAVATPLVVQISYEEVPLSLKNPYGLLVTEVEEIAHLESEPKSGEKGSS